MVARLNAAINKKGFHDYFKALGMFIPAPTTAPLTATESTRNATMGADPQVQEDQTGMREMNVDLSLDAVAAKIDGAVTLAVVGEVCQTLT